MVGAPGLAPGFSWFQTRRDAVFLWSRVFLLFQQPPNIWYGREDSNLHALGGTSSSGSRVYRFHHGRTVVMVGRPGIEPGRRVCKTRQISQTVTASGIQFHRWMNSGPGSRTPFHVIMSHVKILTSPPATVNR